MATTNGVNSKERILFFDPFAKDVDLYCSIRAKRREEAASTNNIIDSDYDDEYDSDTNGYYGEAEHFKADKSRITYTQQLPTPIKTKLKKAEVVDDLGEIRKGAVGPHNLLLGQTVAACVPYDDSESSDSDGGGGVGGGGGGGGSRDRDRNKERWVIAVVLGYDKKRKLYTVKDKYGQSDEQTRLRGGEISWDIAPANVSRFPAARQPRYKPRDRVLALWSTKGSDVEDNSDKEQDGGDEEEWTSVFYDATVVETEDRAGYITIDYGGSSGTRSVRVDKILAVTGRQTRRPETQSHNTTKEKEKERPENETSVINNSKKKLKQEKVEREPRDIKQKDNKELVRGERITRGEHRDHKDEITKPKDRTRSSHKMAEQRAYIMPPIEIRNSHPLDIKLLDDCHVRYYEHLLQNKASLELYEYLLEALPWKEEPVKVNGAAFMESRFTVWFGDEGSDDSRHTPGGRPPSSPTPNISSRPDPWSAVLRDLKTGVERVARSRFNMVIFTYQDGNDYVMTASQNDEERPVAGTVASLALGSDCRVKLTHRTKTHKQDLSVTTGSILVLEGSTAENYMHILPKLRGAGRILVTFRTVAAPDFSLFAEVPSPVTNSSIRKRKWETETGEEDDMDGHGEEDDGKDERPPTEFQCGDVPGVLPGTKFANRIQLSDAGVHRLLVGSVCGTETEGAESILLAGATYDQDFDIGSEFCVAGAVMGTGKNRLKAHSSWQVQRGTQALMTSCIRALPVRVVRSSRLRSDFAPQSGFSYDGLYRVSQYWEEPTKNGQSVWRIKLGGPTPTSKPRLPPPMVVPGTTGASSLHGRPHSPHHHPMEHIDLTMGPPSPPSMVPGMGSMGGMGMGMGMGSHQLHPPGPLKQHPPSHPDRFDHPSSSRSSVMSLPNFTLPPPILSHPSQNPTTLDPSPMHPLSPTLSPFQLRNSHQQRSYLPPTPRRSIIDPFLLPNSLPPPTSQYNYPPHILSSQYPPHSHSHPQHPHHPSHLPPPPPPPPYHPSYSPQYPLPRMWDDLPKQ